ESYTLYTLSGAPRSAFERFPMPRTTAVFGPTFRGEGIVRIDDVTQDPRYGHNAPYHGMPEGHLPVRSYLAVPVVTDEGEVEGGLFLGHSQAGVFTEAAESVAVSLARDPHAATRLAWSRSRRAPAGPACCRRACSRPRCRRCPGWRSPPATRPAPGSWAGTSTTCSRSATAAGGSCWATSAAAEPRRRRSP